MLHDELITLNQLYKYLRYKLLMALFFYVLLLFYNVRCLQYILKKIDKPMLHYLIKYTNLKLIFVLD